MLAWSIRRAAAAAVVGVAAVGMVLSSVGPAAADGGTGVSTGPLVRTAGLAVIAPAGATDEGAAAATDQGSLQVVVAPSDPAGLSALVSSLYNPSSPDYHHWLTPSQFAARFGPSAATVSGVDAWLRGRGLSPTRSSTFAFTVQASVTRLGQATGTAFRRYRSAAGTVGLVAPGAPLVPAGLRSQVLAIQGLSTLPAFSPTYRSVPPGSVRQGSVRPGPFARSSARVPGVSAPQVSGVAACSNASSTATSISGYTMDQLTPAYGLDSLLSAGLTGSGQKVAVYELSPYVGSDVSTYEQCFHLSNPVSRVSVDRGAHDSSGTIEADLDIEQVATQAPGASIVSYEAPNSDSGAYDLWARIVSDDAAKVVSTSWASCELDAAPSGELSGSMAYGPLFVEAASQGQTILAASGDSGSEGCAEDYLSSSPPSYAGNLAVDYPASDPNVTAVGGTDYYGPAEETGWNDCYGSSGPGCAINDGYQAASGGGISSYENRPAWQPYGAGPCPACREVPDISANAGIPMVEYDNGRWDAALGTSFAAPFLAGMVADRNQGCAASTGNFSPTLYGMGAGAFNLPTVNLSNGNPSLSVGNNDMMGGNGGAYPVTSGYNLVTGLGVPIGSGLSCAEVQSVTPASGTGGQVTISGLGLEGAQIYFGTTLATVQSATATSATVEAPAGLAGPVVVSARYAGGAGTMTATYTYPGSAPTTTTTTTAPSPPPAPTCATASGRQLAGAAGIAAVDINGCDGYFVVDSAGQIAAFGSARSHGDLSGHTLKAPIIAIEATPDGQGYWLLGADGGVFSYGDAHFFGSTGGWRLNAPVVGMAVTPDNKGYWIVAKDGGVFTFGDARFFGSTGNLKLVAPVDGIAVAPGGHGYWLVASDGGVFTFTSDGFYGSLGRVRLAKPIVGMSSTPDGLGYTLVGSDGGVFSFGDAAFFGSLGSHPPSTPIVDLSPAPGDNGYYLVSAGGAVFAFGPGARFFGNA